MAEQKYGLIIIDDEEMMRDGLSSFLKWDDLGFRLDGIFEDGRDAMDWLGENDTHVILTDLRMTHASGLDVASFIREKGLNIKVVIISGYSDFEAAREAMGLRVSDYLLKPISVKKVRATFNRLKEELDAEFSSRVLIDDEIERYESLKSYAEERFIGNLMLGALRRPEDLRKQLELINWDKRILDKPCLTFSLRVNPSPGDGDLEHEERNSLIGGMIARQYPPPRFYWYRTSEEDLGGVLFGCGELEGLKERVETYLNNIIKQAKNLSLCLEVRHVRPFENLDALARNREAYLLEMNRESLREEKEQKKRAIISHILENQEDLAREMLNSYMGSLLEKGWDVLVNGLVELFYLISETFDKGRDGDPLVNFADLFSVRDRAAFYAAVRSLLGKVMDKVRSDSTSSRISLVNRAKEYVDANYRDDVMLAQVAREVNLSPVYLSRLFKEQGGINFSDYLIGRRIDEARRLLRETDHKIYEISEEVGYRDVKHFYGLFKKICAMTPSEYRHAR